MPMPDPYLRWAQLTDYRDVTCDAQGRVGVIVECDGSVAQLANYTPERFLAGSMMGYDLVVDVSVAQADPTHIEATFSGTLTGNDSVTMKIEDGRFVYRE